MRVLILMLSLLVPSLCFADEREELALVLKQLTLLESTLERAQQQADTGMAQRFYFDYPRLRQDIDTLRSGINHYLTPARAQPRNTSELSGQYHQERNEP